MGDENFKISSDEKTYRNILHLDRDYRVINQ